MTHSRRPDDISPGLWKTVTVMGRFKSIIAKQYPISDDNH
jgi:hypothetical protein